MPNHTTIIIIVTVIVSLMAWQSRALYNQLIFNPVWVSQGQWHRLVTYGLIHADGTHLLFNMFTLYFFGRAIEQFYNQYVSGFGFVVFYGLAIIASILPSHTTNKGKLNYFSLGASGGVSAVLFAYILIKPWSMLYLMAIIPIPAIIFAVAYVAYGLYANKKGSSRINHSAHLWGGAFGVVATIAINPNIMLHFFYELMHPKF